MNRISYNIHAATPGIDRTKLITHLQAIQPAWALVMDGIQLAKDIKAAVPTCNVIVRIFPDEEGWHTETPIAWVKRKLIEVGGADLWCYTWNEEGFSDALIDWWMQCIPLAAAAGLKIVIGNLSVGTPQPEDWQRPKVIALLRLMERFRDNVVFALHEYACGAITSGLIGGYPDNAGVKPGTPGGRNLVETWPKPEEVDVLTRFHMGRFEFLLDACKNAGIATPRLIMTEWGFDDVSDIQEWAKAQPQTPPYTSLRGWKSLVNSWAKWYPHMSAQEALANQLEWADRAIYARAGVEGMMLFCWGHSSSQWEQFDLSGATDFQKLLESYVSPPTPPPAPAPIPPLPPLPPLPLVTRDQLQNLLDTLTIAHNNLNAAISTLQNLMKG